jgi:hypothetical protein
MGPGLFRLHATILRDLRAEICATLWLTVATRLDLGGPVCQSPGDPSLSLCDTGSPGQEPDDDGWRLCGLAVQSGDDDHGFSQATTAMPAIRLRRGRERLALLDDIGAGW